MMMMYGVNKEDAGIFALLVHGNSNLFINFVRYLWTGGFAADK